MRYKYYIYSIIGNNSAGIYILIFIEKKMLISRGGFATLNIIQYNFHSSPGLPGCSPPAGVGPPPRHHDGAGQSHHLPGGGHRDGPLSPLSSLRS